jgi:hypothetical protein
MAQTLGLIALTWRGQALSIEKGGKVKLGGLMQKEVITGQQVNYCNEMVASEVTANMKMDANTVLLGIWAPGQGELQVICDTGQSYVWGDAFLTNMPEFTAGDGGKVPLKFGGGAPLELV